MRVVSLFSGCGGMDLGFQQAGFTILRAADNDPAAVAVHAQNIGGEALVCDLTETDFAAWRADLGQVDVVLGGFPCQGFSKAGPKRQSDPRNRLFLSMRDAVAELRPAYFVAENVEGLAQNFGGQFLSLIKAEFGAIGYSVEERLVDAIGYGVAQHRRRIIFVGRRIGLGDSVPAFDWPAPSFSVSVRNGETTRAKSMATHLHGLEYTGLWELPPARVISEVISDLLTAPTGTDDHVFSGDWPSQYDAIIRAIGPGQKLCNVRHGPESVRTWDIPEAFGDTTTEERLVLETIARNRRHKEYGSIPNGNPLPVDVVERLTGVDGLEPTLRSLEQRKFVKKKNDGYDLLGAMFASGLFKRPQWDEPSPTVLTDSGNPRYFLHPLEDRPFTVRESARLQGFPDSYQFISAGVSTKDAYRLIGNAVPPPLALAMATQIAEDLGYKNELAG